MSVTVTRTAAPTTGTGGRGSPVLLLTTDERLGADVTRLAAAAGAPVELLADPDAAVRSWGRAAAVLVGSDLVGRLAALAPPRRPDVHVVGAGAVPDVIFRAALDVGASTVLELPAGENALVRTLTDLVDQAGAGGSTTVAVVGGSGGVGATVLTIALGLVAARRGEDTVLVDLDPWGPGIARVAGIDVRPEVTWRELALSPGRFGARSLREALATPDGPGVLGWDDAPDGPPPPAVAREALSAAARGHEWVVVDLPRRDEALAAEVLPHCDATLLVAGASLGSVAATARVSARLRDAGPPPGLVVRARRGGLAPEDVSAAIGLPLLGVVPDQRRLDEHLDLGVGPVYSRRGVLSRAAAELLDGCEVHR